GGRKYRAAGKAQRICGKPRATTWKNPGLAGGRELRRAFAGLNLRANLGKRPGMMLLEEFNEPLADVAAEIESLAGIGGGGQDAQLHGALGHVGDLKVPELFVPIRMRFDQASGLGANHVDGHAEIGPDENGA